MNEPIMYSTTSRPRLDLLDPTPGEHLWAAFAVYRVTAETLAAGHGGRLHLDRENLATIEIGCFVCERAYSGELTNSRCTGDPQDARRA